MLDLAGTDAISEGEMLARMAVSEKVPAGVYLGIVIFATENYGLVSWVEEQGLPATERVSWGVTSGKNVIGSEVG